MAACITSNPYARDDPDRRNADCIDCAFAPEYHDMHYARDSYGKLFSYYIEKGPEEANGYLRCCKEEVSTVALRWSARCSTASQ